MRTPKERLCWMLENRFCGDGVFDNASCLEAFSKKVGQARGKLSHLSKAVLCVVCNMKY